MKHEKQVMVIIFLGLQAQKNCTWRQRKLYWGEGYKMSYSHKSAGFLKLTLKPYPKQTMKRAESGKEERKEGRSVQYRLVKLFFYISLPQPFILFKCFKNKIFTVK